MDLRPINPDDWYEAFKDGVDILFVEAFWRGSGGVWKGIAYDYNVKERELLKRIVRWSKKNGIPTVFWNKEDPSHFDEFIDLALGVRSHIHHRCRLHPKIFGARSKGRGAPVRRTTGYSQPPGDL